MAYAKYLSPEFHIWANKRHDNVIQSIKNIISTLESTGGDRLSFQPVKYKDKKRETRPMFTMDRDAFSVLVFGFNGAEALKFKVDFIKEFNHLE